MPGHGGKLCEVDSDNDGWSDVAQSCSDWGCAKVGRLQIQKQSAMAFISTTKAVSAKEMCN